jgi:lipopolysaccharide export LptBFGC system permease protein LptF
MPRDSRRGQQLLALFCLGALLLSYPVLAVFNHSLLEAGIPLLVLYLFGVWAALIALTAWLIER